MNIVGTSPLANGNIVKLATTNPLHFSDKPAESQNDDVAVSFKDALSAALQKTNDLQVESDNLTRKMITNPESVDVHSVMIAGQKAEIAITFVKAVRDEAVRSYRELMNLR